MERYLSPSHLFLGLSALMTLSGIVHVVAPELALQFEGLSENLLKDEVTNVLYRSYGLAMMSAGAAYCALHKSPTTFALRTMGAMHVISLIFSGWVANRPNHLAVSGGLPAIWGLLHLVVAIYLLTARHGHHGHHATSTTAAVAAAPARAPSSPSPRRRGRPRKAE